MAPNKNAPSPIPQTLPQLAGKVFELSKQNLMLLQRLVELEELHLQTRFFVQQAQTIICALAGVLNVDVQRFADAIIDANSTNKEYEAKLAEALEKTKEQRSAANIKDIKEIV